MTFGGKKALLILCLGDIAVLAFSLWLTLLLRYQEVPTSQTLTSHFVPFSFLFALWMLVFYMSGLYGKGIILFKSKLINAILKTQLFNIVLAALFFFFVPGIAIAPKTNLGIYLVVSLVLISLWRLFVYPRITIPASRERAVVVGAGSEIEELKKEINGNGRYYLEVVSVISPEEASKMGREGMLERLRSVRAELLVIDTEHESLSAMLPLFYEITAPGAGYQFVDFYQMYEEVFDRVPLSLLTYEWFLSHIPRDISLLYAFGKRSIDIVGGALMGLCTLLVLPFVWIAMRIEGKGPLFIAQTRLGEGGTKMQAYKFRSMRFNDATSANWVGEGENRVTRVGAFLRQTSLDEFPQFLNILKGELSLIGPRNDIEGLGIRLAESIPYYNIRYVVRPGITGWAQINQQYEQGKISPQSIEETKVRLAYDFYYIKNRSLMLDVMIALKTVKRMLFRVSSW